MPAVPSMCLSGCLVTRGQSPQPLAFVFVLPLYIAGLVPVVLGRVAIMLERVAIVFAERIEIMPAERVVAAEGIVL
jgi:hypothetical protein